MHGTIYTCCELMAEPTSSSCDAPAPKRHCSCGADLSTLSEYHINKHLKGSKHKRQVTASGNIRTIDAFLSPGTSPLTQDSFDVDCADLEDSLSKVCDGVRRDRGTERSSIRGHETAVNSYRCSGYKPCVPQPFALNYPRIFKFKNL